MNHEPIEQEDKEEQIKKVSYVKPLIITLTVIVLIPVLLYIGLIIIMSGTTQYSTFTKARTEAMEEIFNITVTDEVKLLHYEDISFLIAVDKCLTLEVEDYEKFIHNNINADIEEYTFSSAKEDTLYYQYDDITGKIYVEISPSESKGKYIICLTHT